MCMCVWVCNIIQNSGRQHLTYMLMKSAPGILLFISLLTFWVKTRECVKQGIAQSTTSLVVMSVEVDVMANWGTSGFVCIDTHR